MSRSGVQGSLKSQVLPARASVAPPPPLCMDANARGFPRIVAFGGGTGLPGVLRGLADAMLAVYGEQNSAQWTDRLAAIVTVTDGGASSGRLRRDLGVLPAGDIRNCLVALSADAAFGRLLDHRFEGVPDVSGHAIGTLMLAALTRMTGSFPGAVDEMARLLSARGRVFPSACADVTLRAELATGEIVEGDAEIARHSAPIRHVSLARRVRPWPDALRALINADVVVIGPGSLYTNVLPNLLVDGVSSTLAAVSGVRICVANLMTQPGETGGMSLDDHLRVLREHTGHDLFDCILVNSTQPTQAQLARYRRAGSEMIARDGLLYAAGHASVIEADLLDVNSDHIRHDGAKLAAAILDIAQRVRRPDPVTSVLSS